MNVVTQPVRTQWANASPVLMHYYDTEWGDPVTDEHGVFERLSLEAFQSGLSWLTVLQKRDAFRVAFANFDPDIVADFDENAVLRLLENTAIIRNRRKIEAVIRNARATIQLRNGDYKDLAELVWAFMPDRSPVCEDSSELPTTSPESEALARELKRRGFTFVGPTTAHAMMAAIGIIDLHVVNSYRRGCSGVWNADGTRAVR